MYWEPDLCSHSANCVRSLRSVFRPKRRPWIQLSAEPGRSGADRIAEAVLECPTGALHYERRDGGPDEQPPEPPDVRFQRDGPVELRGRICVRRPGSDEVVREDVRVSLCRCGVSARMPFCDGSHRGDVTGDPCDPAGAAREQRHRQ